MIHKKKGVELSFNVLIIAILCLIVLVIIVSIFRQQIGEIAQGFTKIREKEADESIIEGAFGCVEGSTKCIDGSIYTCKSSEWVDGRKCPDKCSKGSCV
ncbi:hypothetical protein ACFLZ6_01275 [Nanoarchaeota archaeon]